MIKLKTSKRTFVKAKHKAKEIGNLNNSITNGDGNIAGFLGEIVVQYLTNAKECNTYDYDLVLPDGKTVDVKTKRTGVEPKPYYDCSVAALNTRQNTDYYAFVRISNDYKYAWFLGIIEKEKYYANARFLKKGDVDGDNGFVVKSDCYNMTIEDVLSFTDTSLIHVDKYRLSLEEIR